MNWQKHKEDLQEGKAVTFKPKGNSMKPRIYSGDEITIEPIKDYSKISKGDIVFCKVKGNHYVHLVKATSDTMDEKRFQIGNNKGHVNGWIGTEQLFGKVTRVNRG
jgi:signal peptidase I